MKINSLSFIFKLILCGAILQLHQIQVHGRALNEEEIAPRIGVVGAGVGGTSCAYYLRQLFGPKAAIDVFETGKVGGRTAVINIGGREYEAGASIIHNKNRYMVDFAKMFNTTTITYGGGRLGLYGEDGMQFETSSWLAVTLGKLAWRYGWDLKTVQDWTKNLLTQKFDRIYEFQDAGMSFTSVEDLLRAMGEDMVNLTKQTMEETLQQAGLSQRFIDEFGFAAMRNNYGQTTAAHGFVGAVAMVGAEPGLWSVKGGNKLIPENLLKASGADLIKGTVNTVALVKDDLGSGSVTYEVEYTKEKPGKDGEKSGTREYDILVMAAPLSGVKNKISFVEFPRDILNFKQEYHKTVAMFVQGKVNLTTFKMASQDDFPSDLFSVSPNVYFNSIGKLAPANPKEGNAQEGSGEAVWKTFLNRLPTEGEISELFESRSDLRLVEWWAYPEYSKGMDLPPFMLYDKLYYVNAVESAAAAMEMNVIGARNVALLAYNQWHGNFEKIDEVQLPSAKSEDSTERSDL